LPNGICDPKEKAMTAQVPETIFIDGEAHALLGQPLEARFGRRHRRPLFRVQTTACWRGYLGTWSIMGDRLHLLELEGHLRDGSPVSVQTVFPGTTGPLFAQWFSGELRIPTGEMIRYVHMGFESQYVSERIISIERGVVTANLIRQANDLPKGPHDIF
jgi:hypothetical protein